MYGDLLTPEMTDPVFFCCWEYHRCYPGFPAAVFSCDAAATAAAAAGASARVHP